MNEDNVTLAGAHHTRIPVSDLEAAVQWFVELLGYEKEFPFITEGSITGWALHHAHGGPSLTLIEDPERAKACRGFPLFAFGVPDEATVRSIAARLDARGILHGGVQPALVKVKLPFVEGPDGILFGFYVRETTLLADLAPLPTDTHSQEWRATSPVTPQGIALRTFP